jgi:oligopeptide transport system ATP-binding protein
MKLLEIKNLCTEFQTSQGAVQAVRDVSVTVDAGDVLGLVGESGSGKSVTALSLMGLLASNGKVTRGEMLYKGRDISPAGAETKREKRAYEKMMRGIRGKEIGMIFQDPMTYLNPILRIGVQLTEGILAHEQCGKKAAYLRAVELMEKVKIPEPRTRIRQYPYEFSGGMRQRVVIASALAMNPDLIIADEPTTALDVTVQAQILALLKTIVAETGSAVIMITHDLGVVATLCRRIAIMYAGKIVEEGLADEIFYEPRHPYTDGLLKSVHNAEAEERQDLVPIPGTPPDLLKLPSGCAFTARCKRAMRICKEEAPPAVFFSESHSCSCWLHSMPDPERGAVL